MSGRTGVGGNRYRRKEPLGVVPCEKRRDCKGWLGGKGLRPSRSSEVSHPIDRRSPSKYGLSEDSHMRQGGLLSWPCPSPALMGAGGRNRASASGLSPQQCSSWRFSGGSLEGTLSTVVTSLSLSKAVLSHFASSSTHYSWLEVSQQLRVTFVEPSRLGLIPSKVL